eukprot:UN16809
MKISFLVLNNANTNFLSPTSIICIRDIGSQKLRPEPNLPVPMTRHFDPTCIFLYCQCRVTKKSRPEPTRRPDHFDLNRRHL